MFKNFTIGRRTKALTIAIAMSFVALLVFGIASFMSPIVAGGNTAYAAYISGGVQNLILNIGSDESQRNVVWYSTSSNDAEARIALKSDFNGIDFPENYETALAACTAASLSGFNYCRATFVNLTENTEYVYRVGNNDGWSDIHGFKTGTFGGSFSFLAAGDPQIGSSGNAANDTAGWQQTLTHMKEWFGDSIDFMITLGDQVETANNESEYNGFLTPDYVREFTVATNLGNHDVNAKYNEHFYMPNTSTAYGVNTASGNYWYSYNGVLFIGINSNITAAAGHSAFIGEVIEAFKVLFGKDPVWKIVSFHHSPYSGASHANSDARTHRENYSQMFSDYDIDLVLGGHDHSYVRSYMMGATMQAEGTTGRGLVAITDANKYGSDYSSYTKSVAGETLYISANSASGSKYYGLITPDYGYIACSNQENVPSISKIDVAEKAITITTYRTGAAHTQGNIIDTFTLYRGEPAEEFEINYSIVNGGGSTVSGIPAQRAEGQLVSFILGLAKGKAIESISINDDEVDYTLSGKQITFTMPGGAVNIVITLKDVDTPVYYVKNEAEFRAAVTSIGNSYGTITLLTDITLSSNFTYSAGGEITVTSFDSSDKATLSIPVQNAFYITSSSTMIFKSVDIIGRANVPSNGTATENSHGLIAGPVNLQSNATMYLLDNSVLTFTGTGAYSGVWFSNATLYIIDSEVRGSYRSIYASSVNYNIAYLIDSKITGSSDCFYRTIGVLCGDTTVNNTASGNAGFNSNALRVDFRGAGSVEGTLGYILTDGMVTLSKTGAAASDESYGIVYTTDGSIPGKSLTQKLYTEPFVISEHTVVKVALVSKVSLSGYGLNADYAFYSEIFTFGYIPSSGDTDVDAVMELIYEIPAEVRLTDEAVIIAARAAYDALNSEKQALTANYNLLVKAEKALAELKTVAINKAKADSVAELINLISDAVTLNDREDIEAAKVAYDELIEEQRIFVLNYAKLENAESVLAEILEEIRIENQKAADTVIYYIGFISNPVTIADEAMIFFARAYYTMLTEDQKVLVTNYETLLNAEACLVEIKAEMYKGDKGDNGQNGKDGKDGQDGTKAPTGCATTNSGSGINGSIILMFGLVLLAAFMLFQRKQQSAKIKE